MHHKKTTPTAARRLLPTTSCSPSSLAEKIAAALLTPHGRPEGTRLVIKKLMGDGTEKDLGGNCKQSIIDTINRVTSEHEESLKRQPGCCPDCSDPMRPLPTNRWYCSTCGIVKTLDGSGKRPRESSEANS